MFVDEGVCGVRKTLHSNLASLVTDETSVRTLNIILDIVKNTCANPAAHNALVSLLDAVTDVTTNEVVAKTLGDLLHVARKVLKEPEFRVVWQEVMKGLNMLFNNAKKIESLLDMVFTNITELMHSENFDTNFENVVTNFIPLLRYQNLPLMGLVGKMLTMGGKHTGRSQFDKATHSRVYSNHSGRNDHGRSKQRRFDGHTTGNVRQ